MQSKPEVIFLSMFSQLLASVFKLKRSKVNHYSFAMWGLQDLLDDGEKNKALSYQLNH